MVLEVALVLLAVVQGILVVAELATTKPTLVGVEQAAEAAQEYVL